MPKELLRDPRYGQIGVYIVSHPQGAASKVWTLEHDSLLIIAAEHTGGQ
jgi:hypothetical protein